MMKTCHVRVIEVFIEEEGFNNGLEKAEKISDMKFWGYIIKGTRGYCNVSEMAERTFAKK